VEVAVPDDGAPVEDVPEEVAFRVAAEAEPGDAVGFALFWNEARWPLEAEVLF
jgi:hypothetical protein